MGHFRHKCQLTLSLEHKEYVSDGSFRKVALLQDHHKKCANHTTRCLLTPDRRPRPRSPASTLGRTALSAVAWLWTFHPGSPCASMVPLLPLTFKLSSSWCNSLWRLSEECTVTEFCPSLSLHPHLLSPTTDPLLGSPWLQQWQWVPEVSSALCSGSCLHGVSLVFITCLTQRRTRTLRIPRSVPFPQTVGDFTDDIENTKEKVNHTYSKAKTNSRVHNFLLSQNVFTFDTSFLTLLLRNIHPHPGKLSSYSLIWSSFSIPP